ncbi:hypothetical protein Pan14r_49620 [Crateriforma conspicua]|uniref:Uncharacterized protein n=1 Tax=Crateriforma conspicua TaxID=2527996 RepID=A0A5C5YH79_9PLAN|nr:hypothetical protein Pan14r_49620 [Crateriforma conspicua]
MRCNGAGLAWFHEWKVNCPGPLIAAVTRLKALDSKPLRTVKLICPRATFSSRGLGRLLRSYFNGTHRCRHPDNTFRSNLTDTGCHLPRPIRESHAFDRIRRRTFLVHCDSVCGTCTDYTDDRSQAFRDCRIGACDTKYCRWLLHTCRKSRDIANDGHFVVARHLMAAYTDLPAVARWQLLAPLH